VLEGLTAIHGEGTRLVGLLGQLCGFWGWCGCEGEKKKRQRRREGKIKGGCLFAFEREGAGQPFFLRRDDFGWIRIGREGGGGFALFDEVDRYVQLVRPQLNFFDKEKLP